MIFQKRKSSTRPAARGYDLKFDGVYTVQEFIDYILKKRGRDWGEIDVSCESEQPKRLEYFHGEVKSDNIPKRLKNRIIISAKGWGGWSRADYVLTVSDKSKRRRKQ